MPRLQIPHRHHCTHLGAAAGPSASQNTVADKARASVGDLQATGCWVLMGSQPNRGVSPFGHKTHLRGFIDPALLQHDGVWAATGTWHDVFGIEPRKLVGSSEGLVMDLKRS